MAYGITVWGSITDTKSKSRRLFLAQKKIIRVLFGDREKYNEKFRTCVRTRPYLEQKLPPEFYIKERSKPLFNKTAILNLKNLYVYHCANETFKMLKFRNPIAMYGLYKISNRGHKQHFIINPSPSVSFIYKSSSLWNKIRSILHIDDASVSVSSFKQNLIKYLLGIQKLGDETKWIEHNFFTL